MLAKYVFSGEPTQNEPMVDVLKTGEKLSSRDDFVQLAKSVAFVMRNSGHEIYIPVFFEELLNDCKPDLTYEQVKGTGDTSMRIANELYQEEKRKAERKTKSTLACPTS